MNPLKIIPTADLRRLTLGETGTCFYRSFQNRRHALSGPISGKTLSGGSVSTWSCALMRTDQVNVFYVRDRPSLVSFQLSFSRA